MFDFTCYAKIYQTSYEWRVQKVCVLSLSLNFCNALNLAKNNYFASPGRYAFEAVLNNKTDTEYKYIWLVAIIGYRTIFHYYRQWPSSPIIPKLHEPGPKLVERVFVFIFKSISISRITLVAFAGILSNVIDTIVHTAHYRKIFSSQLGFQCIVAAKQAYIID
uniref:Uncharacterized protein n=1 Tax=Glossina palpalis gambiensis TaxID=67801 RepID=A0A1B0BPR2_9MUSC